MDVVAALNRFGRFRGGGGGGGFGGFNPFGGGAPGGDADSNNGHTPTAKVSAVSDDHGNALVVSAPDSLIPTIDVTGDQVTGHARGRHDDDQRYFT